MQDAWGKPDFSGDTLDGRMVSSNRAMTRKPIRTAKPITMMGERFFLFSMFVILLRMNWSYPGKIVRGVCGSERPSELNVKSDHLRRRSLIPKDTAVSGRF